MGDQLPVGCPDQSLVHAYASTENPGRFSRNQVGRRAEPAFRGRCSVRDRPQVENVNFARSKLFVAANAMLPPPMRWSVSPVPFELREDRKFVDVMSAPPVLNRSSRSTLGSAPVRLVI